jgi:putative ABC transport system permease protein
LFVRAGTRAGDTCRDLRYGLRTLRRNPGFSLIVILTLALGIGANTAIFSVVNGVLLQPLPYESPERQVRLQVITESRTGSPEIRPLSLTVTETRELAQRSHALERIGNIAPSLSNWPHREPRWSGAAVTASVFSMLGVRAVLGRVILPDDERQGAPSVIVLSDRAWQRHFGGDPAVLGQTIVLEPALRPGGTVRSTAYTVVGVAPAGFDYLPGSEAQYWIPLRSPDRGSVVARLAPGTSASSVLAQLEPAIHSLYARTRGARALAFQVVGLQEQLVAAVKPALLLLMGAVVFVLLIACVNVANLLLVRSVARTREVAIRVAIGAGQGRVVRLMAIEGLLLTGVATVFGTAIAAGGISILRWLASTADRIDLGQGGGRMIPRLEAVGVDWHVLAFTITVASGVGAVFCLIPAIQQRRMDLSSALRRGSASNRGGRFHTPALGSGLVIAEVALATVLLVGGGLLIASFVKLLRVDTGYDPAQVLTFQVSLPSERYGLSRLQAFAEEFVGRLDTRPGVTAAAYANQLPLVQLRDSLAIGRTPEAYKQPGAQSGDVRLVSRTYFRTMRIGLVGGRLFEERDGAGQPRVVIVNEALARRDFDGSSGAIGHQVYVGAGATPWTVIGVVADVRQLGLALPAAPQFFIDARQWGKGLSPLFPLSPYYTLRFEGEESAALTAVRSVLERTEPEGVLFNVASMDAIISSTVARPRVYAVLLGALAMAGVTMALVGIYGVMSCSVAQRTRELGIRVALGASPGAVLGLVLRHSLVLTAAGLAFGLAGAALLTRTLEALLFELTPLDPATFSSVTVAFVVAAGLAAVVPARRAARVDPLAALRTE